MKRVRRSAARVPLSEQLERALEKIMADREAAQPRVNPRIAALMRIAADLRDLPADDFKARLRDGLESRALSSSGERMTTAVISEIAPRPEGFHSITPCFQVEGAAEFIDFMKRAFGAEEIFRVKRPDSDRIAHAQLKVEGSMIELADATEQFKVNPTAMWLFVEDADATYERAIRAGAITLQAPADRDYGDRDASVKDPFGNHWYIATHREDAEPLPEEVRTVTPFLHPKASGAVIDFMKQTFGAEEAFRAQDDAGTVYHAKVRIGDSMIAMGDAHGPWNPMPPALHVFVADADLVYSRAIGAGAKSLYPPADAAHGERSAGVTDPFDNVWYIATLKQRAGAERRSGGNKTVAKSNPVPPGASPFAPYLSVSSAAAMIDFYGRAFGAIESYRLKMPDGRIGHAEIRIGAATIMLADEFPEMGLLSPKSQGIARSPVGLHLYVEDVDAVYKRAVAEGATSVKAPEDEFFGERNAHLTDPSGHLWFISSQIESVTPEEMQRRLDAMNEQGEEKK